jgi:hypothetical protein
VEVEAEVVPELTRVEREALVVSMVAEVAAEAAQSRLEELLEMEVTEQMVFSSSCSTNVLVLLCTRWQQVGRGPESSCRYMGEHHWRNDSAVDEAH